MIASVVFTLLPAIAGITVGVGFIYLVSTVLTSCIKTRCAG